MNRDAELYKQAMNLNDAARGLIGKGPTPHWSLSIPTAAPR